MVMAHLDWTRVGLKIGIRAHPRHETELQIPLDQDHQQRLGAELGQVLGQAGAELRLDLPQGWTVHWKLCEGETRLLLAHPDAASWVATVAIQAAVAGEFLERLRRLLPGEVLCLSRLPGVSRRSNLELVLARG